MAVSGILGMFAGYDFFKEFTEQQLMKLASGARTIAVKAGDYLAREGGGSSGLYLIQSGQVAIDMHRPDKGPVTLQTVGPGGIVGWSWLVPPHRWQFDCRVVEDVTGLGFDGNWLREKCEQDHVLGYHILKQMITVMYNRNAATRAQLIDLYK